MRKIIGILTTMILFFSCDQEVVYEQYLAINDSLWEKEKVYYFTFEIQDVESAYDLQLEIRNNNLYPYQNLWVFCCEERPIGPLIRDTMECMLADEYGKWNGEGFSLFHSRFPVRSHYRFPHAGQYTFSFRHGMRLPSLPGIQEIGFRVEKSNPVNAPSEKHPAAEK